MRNKYFADRKEKLQSELDELAAEERAHDWAQGEVSRYSDGEKRILFAYLYVWNKSQPGHGKDCNCGECD